MEVIRISNVITEGKTPLDYYDNKDYKKFGIHVGTSSLVPVYQELLREVIGDKVNEVFKDYVLSVEEISQIQMVFDRELDVKIKQAFEFVIENNLGKFSKLQDGPPPLFDIYESVRVGVIKTKGKPATIFPDNAMQPLINSINNELNPFKK